MSKKYPHISTWYDEAIKQYKIGQITAPQKEVTRQVIEALNLDTENKIQKALIDLGWTPPLKKVTCPKCGGGGQIFNGVDELNDCISCSGTGWAKYRIVEPKTNKKTPHPVGHSPHLKKGNTGQ